MREDKRGLENEGVREEGKRKSHWPLNHLLTTHTL